jgi:hypothetical protein
MTSWWLWFALACGGGTSAPTPPEPVSTTEAPKPPAPPTPAAPTPSPASRDYQVWFVDGPAYDAGRSPYLVAVQRALPADAGADALLAALFAGPTPDEAARGLRLEANGASRAEAVQLVDGTLSFRLSPTCNGGGSLSFRDLAFPTLRQLDGVKAIHILDPQGSTLDPRPGVDSVPSCLEP